MPLKPFHTQLGGQRVTVYRSDKKESRAMKAHSARRKVYENKKS